MDLKKYLKDRCLMVDEAHSFGTLGSMFPGRVILGIGTGESLNEVPSTGAPWPRGCLRSPR